MVVDERKRRNSWSVHDFGELIAAGVLFVSDGYRAKNEELGGDGYIFLRAGHVTDSHIDFSSAERFHSELSARLGSKISKPGDVIVTTKGNSTGRVAYVNDEMPTFVYSPHLSFWRSLDLNAVVPGFLRYWSQGREFRSQLEGMAASTDMAPYLSLRDQKRLRISLPPPGEQRAMARLLESLDQRIDLNREMNRILEEIARAIFESWFVDFDPVREGHPLFSSFFQESASGEIPADWTCGALTEMVEVAGGGTPSTKVPEYWGGDIPWFSVVDCPSKSDIFVTRTEKSITRLGLDSSSARLLPFGTTIITARGTVGKLALVGAPMAMNQSCYGLSAKEGRGPFFIYFLLSDVVTVLRQRTHGSVFDTITRETLDGVQVAIPPAEVTQAFDRRIQPLMERILNNIKESETLATLRDALLPKLLSGEIRVKQAEKIVGKAV